MAVTYYMVCTRALTVKGFLCKILSDQNDKAGLRHVINDEFKPGTISDKELKKVQQKLHKSHHAGVKSGEVLDYICALNPPPARKSRPLGSNPPHPWQ